MKDAFKNTCEYSAFEMYEIDKIVNKMTIPTQHIYTITKIPNEFPNEKYIYIPKLQKCELDITLNFFSNQEQLNFNVIQVYNKYVYNILGSVCEND